MDKQDSGPEVSEALLQAELERNVCLLRQLANIYDCFGLADHANTIYLTASRVQGVQNSLQDATAKADGILPNDVQPLSGQ